jgi:hypothetical protein
MEKRNLSWGVKFELARLVSLDYLSYQDMTDVILETLAGPNTKAAQIPEVISGITTQPDKAFARENAAKVVGLFPSSPSSY